MRPRPSVIVATTLLALSLVVLSRPVHAGQGEVETPRGLESPRATLRTFLEALAAEPPELERAAACLELEGVAEEAVPALATGPAPGRSPRRARPPARRPDGDGLRRPARAARAHVEGLVEELGLRSVRIRTFYNALVSILSANLVRADVDNDGRRRFRRWRTHLNSADETALLDGDHG